MEASPGGAYVPIPSMKLTKTYRQTFTGRPPVRRDLIDAKRDLIDITKETSFIFISLLNVKRDLIDAKRDLIYITRSGRSLLTSNSDSYDVVLISLLSSLFISLLI